ncbi:MAG: hypothetical protein EOP24_14480 [Hyphomicrobiales bacterium]|nr:MAG: hypothetical protein EOP24_14480 [Hyphomicrobiales bacterium]
MRVITPLCIATLFLGLANPAVAQTDPHHPEGAPPSAVAEEPEGDSAQLAVPSAGNAMTQCPGMMSMMPQGAGETAMPMMQMHMMAMMQMQMQLMQQMQSGGMHQPAPSGSPQMQMMEMMRSMQIMQMDLMQMMQQMRKDAATPQPPAMGAAP